MNGQAINDGAAVDWSQIELVVFDVDGTLYSQRHVRIRMAIRLILFCLRHWSLAPVRITQHYRMHRETLAERELEDFENVLLNDTAKATGMPLAAVKATIDEWLEHRPLSVLRRARYRHLEHVFGALRARGIRIGVLSDYPAVAKLAALELDADLIVWSGQAEVRVLKPHPRGLELLLMRAGVECGHALMIGDRDDRDGEIARRAGVRVFIRSAVQRGHQNAFISYDRAPFDTLLNAFSAGSAVG